MTVQILSQALKKKVRKDDRLLIKLAEANDKKVDTIKLWIRKDSKLMTTYTNLLIIREHYGLSESEVLTEDKREEAATGEQGNTGYGQPQ